MRCVIVLFVFALSCTAQGLLSYLDLTGPAITCCVTTDASGNTYVAQTDAAVNVDLLNKRAGGIRVTKLDRQNNPVFSFRFPGAGGLPLGVAVDPQQNVIVTGIVGQASYSSFPLVNPVQDFSRTQSQEVGFVSKIDTTGARLLFSTAVGGSAAGTDTGLNALATDNSGNIYVAGSSTSPDYPVTSNAFQSAGPVKPTIGDFPRYAVLTKLTADGSRILYSTYVGEGSTPCFGAVRASARLAVHQQMPSR